MNKEGHLITRESLGEQATADHAILYLIEAGTEVAKMLGRGVALHAMSNAYANLAFRLGVPLEDYKRAIGEHMEEIDKGWAMMELAASDPKGEG